MLFTVLYSYQIGYAGVALLKRKAKKHPAPKRLHRYAVVIAARNESNVIGQLIQSIRNQTYQSELVDVYVVADNCTDNTAHVARMSGPTVYQRFNKRLLRKGYALHFILKILHQGL